MTKIWLVDKAVPTAHWTYPSAVKAASMDGNAVYDIVPIELDPISIPVDDYFKFKGNKEPNITQAALFAGSETGELQDEVVQLDGGWVRNNPEDKGHGVAPEGGDVLMMVTKTLEFVGADPIQAMFDKMESKGWKRE